MARRRSSVNQTKRVRHGMALGGRIAAAVAVAALSGGALLASVALPSPAGAQTVIGTPTPTPAPVEQYVGSGSGLVDSFRVVNTSSYPVSLVGYIAKDGRSLDDSLTKGPAPGTVLNKDQYVVIEVTRYFASVTHLDVVFSRTTDRAVQYRVFMIADGTFGVKEAHCFAVSASCEVHGFDPVTFLR